MDQTLWAKVQGAKEAYARFGRYVGSALRAPTECQGRFMLFAVGVLILSSGLAREAYAQSGSGGFSGSGGGVIGGSDEVLSTTYNDYRITEAVNAILTYIEGAFGALVMVAAGLGAIISAAFGQYRAALGLLVVAVGAFILRSLVGTFFNDEGIKD